MGIVCVLRFDEWDDRSIIGVFANAELAKANAGFRGEWKPNHDGTFWRGVSQEGSYTQELVIETFELVEVQS